MCVTTGNLQAIQRLSNKIEPTALSVGIEAIETRVFLPGSFPEIWPFEELIPKDATLFSSVYLNALQYNTDDAYRPFVVGYFEGKKAIGLAVFSLIRISGRELRNKGKLNGEEGFVSGLKNFALSGLDRISVCILACGNPLLTGEYGWFFHPSVSNEMQVKLLESSFHLLQTRYCNNRRISAWLIKDFNSPNNPIYRTFESKGYVDFQVEPNMVLNLSPDWKSFEDYQAALRSKYRVRNNSALQKASELTRVVYPQSSCVSASEPYFRLYKELADTASFNLAYCYPDYFRNLEYLPSGRYFCFSYSKNEEPAGFLTAIGHENVLEVHFMGLNDRLNLEHHLYQNFLLDMIKTGIENGFKSISFGRTAIEIKSTVGAEPLPARLLIHFNYPVADKLVKEIFFRYIKNDSWVIRKPFRKESI